MLQFCKHGTFEFLKTIFIPHALFLSQPLLLTGMTHLLSTVTVAEVLSSVDSQAYSPASSSISWWMVKLRSRPCARIVCRRLGEISWPSFSHWTSPLGLLISHRKIRLLPFRDAMFSSGLINLAFISDE